MTEEHLFDLALNASDVERAALLDRECAGDAGLRARIEALLQADAKSNVTIDSPINRTGSYAERKESAGVVIAGKYKLVEPIGEGGMGSVWLAEQSEPVRRRVALKLIKAGMDSKQVIARFEAERQALAVMDHPNIAKVLDGGLHEGRPYFVMELVKGVPITQYCDAKRLTPRERLELFVPVCQAIQHAHQKGIIHRDIKPSNVLVAPYDDRPVPKVIDFGLAKATGVALMDASQATNFGGVVGTPQYMSPEQASLNNLDIDTRSDIYSLGVLLYELLTGSPPFQQMELEKAGMLEMLRVIREEEPPRPSTKLSTADALPSLSACRGTEPKKLTGILRNELDWIVMKALEKDRARRYETANGFAADINRYLAGEPVNAHPPSAGYRLKKLLRKNKGPVIAASLVALALVVGMIGTAIGMVQADRAREAEYAQRLIAEEKERDARKAADEERQAKEREAAQRAIAVEQRAKAEKARDRTRDVLDAMVSEATGDSLSTQKEISEDQKKFLTEVLTYYREFAGEQADDEQSRARTAQAALRVGRIENRLGRTKEGIKAFQMARDGYRTLTADFPAVPAYRQELAASHNNLGILLADLGKRPEAEDQYRQALAIREKLAADFPAVPAYRQELAGSHNNLGNLLKGLGKRPEAEDQYRQALAIQEKLAADFPAVPVYRLELARSHNNLGILLADHGKRPEAEEQYRKGLAIQEKLAADFPAVPAYRQNLARSHNSLGVLLRDLGKRPEAEDQYRQALAIREKLAADFPAVPAYRRDLAGSHNNLGALLADLGKGPEAEGEVRQALAIEEKLAADFPAVPAYRQELAASHYNLGILLAGLGKRPEAEDQYRKGLAIQEKLAADFPAVPAYRQALAKSHNNLGGLLAGLGKRPEAEDQYRQALAIQEKLVADLPAVPVYRQALAKSHNNLGALLAGLGKRPEAEDQYRQALAIREKLAADFPAVPVYRSELAMSHNSLGLLLAGLGKRPEAEDQDRQALAIREKLAADFPAVPEYRQELATSHNNLGNLLAGLGKRPEAEDQYRQALAIQEKLAADFPAVPEYRQELARSHNNLGILLADHGKRPEAEEQYRKGLAIQEKLAADFPAVPEYRQELATSHNNLGNLLAGLGKRPEAEDQYRQALAIQEKLAADFPAVPEYRQELARSHNNLGILLADLGKRPEAEDQYRQALAIREKLAADFPAVPEYRQELATSHNNLGALLADLGKRPEAEDQYRQALTIQEKLAADFPAVPEYRVELGTSYSNYGKSISDGGNPAEGLKWFDRAIECLQSDHEKEPRDVNAKQILRNSHWYRAVAHDRLKKFAAAIKDWDRAIELSPPAEQPSLRASRATSRLQAGLVAEALADVAELTKTSNINADQWYTFASVYALASGKIADKRQEYANRAMVLLHKAVQAGFHDAAHMKKDTDLDPLREREDFKKLIAELEAKASEKKP